MAAAVTIAMQGVLRSVREHTFLVLPLATATMLAGASAGGLRSLSAKLARDFGTAGLTLYGLVLVVALAGVLVAGERTSGRRAFVLAKPVSRVALVVGTFAALIIVLAIHLTIATAALMLLDRAAQGVFDWRLAMAGGVVLLKLSVFASFCMVLTELAPGLGATLLSVALYVTLNAVPIVRAFLSDSFLLTLLPDLSLFDTSYLTTPGYHFTPALAGGLVVYALVWIGAVLAFATWLVEARE